MDLLEACKKEVKQEPWYISILTGVAMVVACIGVCTLLYVVG